MTKSGGFGLSTLGSSESVSKVEKIRIGLLVGGGSFDTPSLFFPRVHEAMRGRDNS